MAGFILLGHGDGIINNILDTGEPSETTKKSIWVNGYV
ncbi:hypothetical protein ASZ90_018495 [hydrocarbon metagenome]|uniref:Uncharacterized protein n=1 Tax=hydrocarbon metagenome TaxID=938273 RepID=A0A0W8E684_9ZZZZ